METKGFSGADIPAESEGKALVRFAAYNEVDHHKDVTLKGAFEEGAEFVVSAYNHQSWKGALPVGRGVIKDGGDHAQGDIQFFMNTAAGRETFETVKALGHLQQWSYGYDVETSKPGEHEGEKVRFLMKQKVHELSPVLIGAGKSTATLDVKSGNDGNMRMSDQIEEVVTSVESLIDRAEEIVKLRKQDGKKGLSDETAEAMEKIEGLFERLKSLATESTVDAESTDEETVVWTQEVPDDFTALIARSMHNLSEEYDD